VADDEISDRPGSNPENSDHLNEIPPRKKKRKKAEVRTTCLDNAA
jgi:hypothetical protein